MKKSIFRKALDLALDVRIICKRMFCMLYCIQSFMKKRHLSISKEEFYGDFSL